MTFLRVVIFSGNFLSFSFVKGDIKQTKILCNGHSYYIEM